MHGWLQVHQTYHLVAVYSQKALRSSGRARFVHFSSTANYSSVFDLASFPGLTLFTRACIYIYMNNPHPVPYTYPHACRTEFRTNRNACITPLCKPLPRLYWLQDKTWPEASFEAGKRFLYIVRPVMFDKKQC